MPLKTRASARPLSPAPTVQPGRLVTLDHLRGFVVLHHAVLAYCVFGHIDRHHYVLSTAPVVKPEEIAAVITFLASAPARRWCTLRMEAEMIPASNCYAMAR